MLLLEIDSRQTEKRCVSVSAGVHADSHCADVGVEAGEDDASFPSLLQNAGQDDIEVGVHVEVGRQVAVPRPVL